MTEALSQLVVNTEGTCNVEPIVLVLILSDFVGTAAFMLITAGLKPHSWTEASVR